jgi:hypothetical protein
MNNKEELIVPANVPAQVLEIPNSNFNLNYSNDLVTHVKLRVFYQGMTKDKRLFSEEFSNRLLMSLPQTPVVGYWDETAEDFLGHNHTQFIYGYVPENAKFGFETDPDGSKWAVTEIVLFTGRGDNIGKVAQKIIGKKHSLELDSNSMKYSVKRNPDGQMQHIELQDGKFVGLSVLGDNQTPAFEGSTFFTENIKPCELGKCVDEIKEKFSNFVSNTDKTIGGEDVETKTTDKFSAEMISELQKFMRVTEDEMAKGIMEATYGKFGQNIMIVQWSSVDDMIVFMDMADGYYYRVRFFMTGDDTIEMGDKMWVKPRFLTEEEIDMVFPETPEERAELDAEIEKAKEDLANATAAEIPGDEEVKVEEPVAEVVEEKVEAVLPEAEQPVVAVEPEPMVEAPVEAPVVEVVPEVEEKADDEKKAEGIFISESERLEIENDRQELANYRKEKKLAIIEKYSEYLNTDEKLMFSQKVDKYNFESLEAELAKISMEKVLKQSQSNNVAGTFGIRTAPKLQQKPSSDSLASLVERYKGK